MAQEQKGRGRPKFHWWLAEQCYVLVDEVERQNKPITRRQAIYKFLEGPKFANLVNCHELVLEVSRLRASYCLQYQFNIVRSTLVRTQGSRKNNETQMMLYKVYIMVESRTISC